MAAPRRVLARDAQGTKWGAQVKRALWLAPLLFALSGCSGEGNTGRIDYGSADCKDDDSYYCALRRQVPWINGATAVTNPATNGPAIPTSPVYPAINTGAADPGSRVKF